MLSRRNFFRFAAFAPAVPVMALAQPARPVATDLISTEHSGCGGEIEVYKQAGGYMQRCTKCGDEITSKFAPITYAHTLSDQPLFTGKTRITVR